ncbi:MAG: cobaltochelatase subunit CobN [Chloracidobacterium sp.]|nr:cobaltochelatase subunit CobN [Chloracidobacterium sp.]MDW8217829.1 cobaltochelatase subunit CobN [Acidobacteriota bacterium]
MGFYHPSTDNDAPLNNKLAFTCEPAVATGCRDDHTTKLYAAKPDIVFISASDTELRLVAEARKRLPQNFPVVQTQTLRALQRTADLDRFLADIAPTAKIVIARILGGVAYFAEGFDRLDQLHRETGCRVVALPGDSRSDAALLARSTVGVDVVERLLAYCTAGGVENYAQALCYTADRLLGTTFGFAPPQEAPLTGLYHPQATDRDATARMPVADFQRAYWRSDRPAVGVAFYRAYWQSGDLAVVDALISAVEAAGGNVLPVFCYSLRDEKERADGLPDIFARYFSDNGRPRVHVIVSLLSYAVADLARTERLTYATGGAAEALHALGIPVIQAITSGETVADWRASAQGLTPLDAAMKVVMAEFDGRIITTVVGARESDAAGARLAALPEQADAVARLAVRWARLRDRPNAEKRLAIVLTNFANRNGRVGSAVGLDTPASVLNILRALRDAGYTVGDLPPTGDALMGELLAQGGYEAPALSEEQAAHAFAQYRADDYRAWFAALPPDNQAQLRATWGEPPGTVMTAGEVGYIAARRYGNVLVMIQPPRGYGDNTQALYHSGELVPPHHYLAVYHWLRDVFGADAVIHCGKHGTAEWLPGKALGLSGGCYPQLVLTDTPVFYPFLVGDPGEGLQAKRRWHACIVSHLPPPMTQAEVDREGELAPLQALLTELARADQLDPEKRPLIIDAIWEAVVAAHLHRDLGYEIRPDEDEIGAFLKKLDGYLCDLGEIQIRHGLHVFGEAPAGDRLTDMLCALARQTTPPRLGLPAALARDLGLPEDIFDRPSDAPWPPEATPPWLAGFDDAPMTSVGRLRRALDAAVRRLVQELVERNFDPAAVALPSPPEAASAMRCVLTYLAEDIVPRLRQTPDEITNLLAGLDGRAVPPGPSGAPTRGTPDILPTGRNFYAVDIRAVPSPFAWQVGRRLGDALLTTYVRQQGRFPEVVGLTLWGTSNMRTQGDDVAQALWLLGVEPVWQVGNRRLAGLKLLPVETLRRPRVDVVMRVSGFFRDAFPNVLALLDEAVNLAADADEPDEWNAVRKRVRADEARRLAAGESPDEARRRARFRLFSNQPGVYGVGILSAITEGAWESREDLAAIYLRWSGYAYANGAYGAPAEDVFAAQLAACEVAVQNQDNREHDILDSDDYMQFHGGMAAAVRSLRGAAPVTLFGDSADPTRPRVRTLQDELRRVVRARVTNPKWLQAMQEHGYKGALEMAATVDYLFGYSALTGLVEDWMYERVAEAYLFDETTAAFLQRSNPWAQRDIAARLLEAVRRGLWAQPPEAMTARLEAIRAAAEENLAHRRGEGSAG